MASQAINGSMPVHDAGQYSFFDSTGDEGGLEGGLDDGLEGGLEVNIIFLCTAWLQEMRFYAHAVSQQVPHSLIACYIMLC